MAGKIIADTLEHSTAGSLDTQYVVQGSAKAWCKFGPDAYVLQLPVKSVLEPTVSRQTLNDAVPALAVKE